jgi:hypothetical protein
MSGRVDEIESDHVKLVFRNEDVAYVAISSIKFIAPIRKQPSVVV